MTLIYSFCIWCYEKAFFIAAFFHPKAKKWVDGRKNIRVPNTSEKPVIWIHCASLGEYDMAIPIIARLRETYATHFFLVTFFSPSGMEHYQKRGEWVDGACYLPIDRTKKIKRFLRQFNPELLILVKYEFWPNLINEVRNQRIPIVSINTVLRKNQRYFKWYGELFRKTLRKVDFFYVLNAQTSLLLSDIGITQWKITGDTRYDRLVEHLAKSKKNERIEAFLAGDKAIIIGSSWPEDERLLIPIIRKFKSHKFILAPHEIDEAHLHYIERQLKGSVQRFTEKNDPTKTVLLLNTIGHLTSAYAYGKIAYVGGAFSGKLHNILEPLVYHLPLVFGPKFSRNPEASEAIHAGIAQSVQTPNELEFALLKYLDSTSELTEKSKTFIQHHLGSSDIICSDLTHRF
jgi:3-deoxy-D-manno-octulosonic-acid transferase